MTILASVLDETTVIPALDASTRDDVMRLMLDMLCRTGKVNDPEQARLDLDNAVSRMSVGMEHGIAIPHATTNTVDEFVAGVAVTREPLDMDSFDGKPARIFIMTLYPKHESDSHICFLGAMARILKRSANRKTVLAAQTPQELLQALVEARY